MPDSIFISYRRRESVREARAVYEWLKREFGRDAVFIDLEGISLGEEFPIALERQLANCTVLLALLSPGWLEASDESGGRRVDNPNDFVRIEISSALRRGIKVIPICTGGVRVPSTDELPEDMRPLTRRQASKLDFDQFDSGMHALAAAIRKTHADGSYAKPDFAIGKSEVMSSTTGPNNSAGRGTDEASSDSVAAAYARARALAHELEQAQARARDLAAVQQLDRAKARAATEVATAALIDPGTGYAGWPRAHKLEFLLALMVGVVVVGLLFGILLFTFPRRQPPARKEAPAAIAPTASGPEKLAQPLAASTPSVALRSPKTGAVSASSSTRELVLPSTRLSTIGPPSPRDKENAAWATARSNDTLLAYTNYLTQYPNGAHSARARDVIDSRQLPLVGSCKPGGTGGNATAVNDHCQYFHAANASDAMNMCCETSASDKNSEDCRAGLTPWICRAVPRPNSPTR